MDKLPEDADVIHPAIEEILEAKNHPNGWLYRIAGSFRPDEAVPREAIVGAWKVDGAGKIVGAFQPNPNYDPNQFPAKI